MSTEQFNVQNVKCAGCVKAIVDGLSALPQVDKVTVTIEDACVTVQGEGINRQLLSGKLAALGYPEAGSG